MSWAQHMQKHQGWAGDRGRERNWQQEPLLWFLYEGMGKTGPRMGSINPVTPPDFSDFQELKMSLLALVVPAWVI